VQKLPTPTFVTSESEKGVFGFWKKVIKLWFVCPQTGFTCCTETKEKEWQQWAQVGFSAVRAGFAAFKVVTQGDVESLIEGMSGVVKMLQMAHQAMTADPLSAIDGISALFDSFISEPLLTSKENDALIEQLRAAVFFAKMGYDAQTATWVRRGWLEAQSAPNPPLPLFSQGQVTKQVSSLVLGDESDEPLGAARSGPRFGACRFLLLAGYENLAAPLFALPQ
jgi:hypothetical protein